MVDDTAAAAETDDADESHRALAVDYHISDPGLGPKSPLRARLNGFGLSTSGWGGSRYVPYRCIPRTGELDNDTRAAIRELEETPRIYHGAVAAQLLERRYGIARPCAFADVRVFADLLEFYPIELKDLISSCIKPAPGFPARRHAERARDHSAVILALFLDWNERIYRENLDTVYVIEHSVIEPTVSMIENGILLDAERLEEGLSALNRQAHEARERAQAAVGRRFSPSRPADVRAVLYERLGLEAAQRMNDRNSEIDRHKLRRLSAGDLTVGQPIRHGNLAVFPLISSKPKTEDRFITLDQGLKDGSVKIMELGAPNAAERQPADAPSNTRPAASSGGVSEAKAGDGSAAQQAPDAADPAGPDVNHLLVLNHSKKPLYLMPGEIIVGGEQDRTIAQEYVIKPSDKPVQIEVFCVEHGRWHGREDSETASLVNGANSAASLAGSIAFAPVATATAGLTAKAQKGDFIGSVGNVNKAARVAVQDAKTQDKVWEKVAEVNAKSSNKSESGDFAGNYADAETVKQLEPYVTALQKPVADQAQVVGVAIAINGKLDTLDVFESTPLFRQLWPKLLKSYALDAANAEAGRGG